MAYRLGDFVRFVEEDFEGHITKIINDELVGVTGEDGFEIPVQLSKITKVYGQQNRRDVDFDEEVKVLAVASSPFITEGIFLAITGDQKQPRGTFHLVNETSFSLLTSMGIEKAGKTSGLYAGIIHPNSTQPIHHEHIGEVGNWPLFTFQFLFHTPQLAVAKAPLTLTKKIKAFDLAEPKKHVPLLGERAWLLRLDEIEQLDIEKLKANFISHRPQKR
ncbi:hypothetical protein GCM10023231_35390 [Olivibacter ginsenosidimutans]|uniref:EVE domain-containing protein n=1 Tax=Olivibacter ginsenosidimutans TaxID=1176537 RepID=A0ABP9C3K8_9SPHI